MKILVTYKNGQVDKYQSNFVRIVGKSFAYITEENAIRLDDVVYVEIAEEK